MLLLDELIKVGDDTYSIEENGDTWSISKGNNIYTIKEVKGSFLCSCPAFKYSHKKTCKHIEALKRTLLRNSPVEKPKRYPREFIDKVAGILHRILNGIDFEVVGSYRRGTPDSKDIDLLIKGDYFDKVKSILKRVYPTGDEKKPWDLVSPAGTKGSGKKSVLRWYVTIEDKDILVDFLFTEDKYYEPALLFYTGSGDFNMYMRRIAKIKNMKLNQYGLYDRNSDKLVALTERDIFRSLGIPYKEPKDRV